VPAALLSRDEVVARVQDVFRDRGFDGASLTDISKATGLGKSSLYGTPKARLRAMLDILDEFYVGGRYACVLGNFVVGGSRERFRDYLIPAFAGWIAALRALAAEAGVRGPEAQRRAEDAVVRIEGALIVAGGLDDLGPFKRALRNIEHDLLA
jgi:AcrR family transcriptional regulator